VSIRFNGAGTSSASLASAKANAGTTFSWLGHFRWKSFISFDTFLNYGASTQAPGGPYIVELLLDASSRISLWNFNGQQLITGTGPKVDEWWTIGSRSDNVSTWLYWKRLGQANFNWAKATLSTPFANTPDVFLLGRDTDAGQESDMCISGFRWWKNRMLTLEDFEEESRSIAAVDRRQLFGEWKFQNGDRTLDTSGNGNHLTLAAGTIVYAPDPPFSGWRKGANRPALHMATPASAPSAASSAPTITAGATGASVFAAAGSSAPTLTAGLTSSGSGQAAGSSAPTLTAGMTGAALGAGAASSAPTITAGATGAALSPAAASSAPTLTADATSSNGIVVGTPVFANDSDLVSSSNTRTLTGLVVAANDTIHLWVTNDSSAGVNVSGIADNVNGVTAWPGTVLDDKNDVANGQRVTQFRREGCAAGTYTITVTFTGGTGGNTVAKGACAVTISGAASPSLDQHAGNQQATPTTGTDLVTTTSMSPTKQPGVLVALSFETVGNPAPSAGTAFTSIGTGWNFGTGTAFARVEKKSITSMGAVAGTFTAGSNSAHTTLGAIYSQAGASAGASVGDSSPSITAGATGASRFTAAASSAPTITAGATGRALFTGAASSAPTMNGDAASPNPKFPLTVSANSRYLQDQQGTPFPIRSDAAWTLSVHATDAGQRSYLDQLVVKGFTAFHGMNIAHNNGGDPYPLINEPNDINNTPPFTTPDQLDTANDVYFARISRFIAEADRRGITVMLFHTYMGFAGGTQGWEAVITSAHNTNTICFNWGVYLATKLPHKNIQWMHMGDHTISGTALTRFQQIVAGIQSVRRTQLASSELDSPNTIATDQTGFAYGTDPATSDMQFDWFYGWGASNNGRTYVTADRAYADTTTLPVMGGEMPLAGFAFGPPTGRSDVRRYAHWAITAGATGGVSFGEGGRWDWPSDSAALATFSNVATADAALANAFYASIPWYLMRPSGTATGYAGRALIVSGGGANDTKITSCMTSTGSHLLAYCPVTGTTATQTFSVDLRSMNGSCRARWWNPTTGVYTDITGGLYSLANSLSAQSFVTPGDNGTSTNDWMLVIDALPSSNASSAPTITVAATGAALKAGAGSSAPTLTADATGKASAQTSGSSAPPITADATGHALATSAGSSAPTLAGGMSGASVALAVGSSAPTLTGSATGRSLAAAAASSAPTVNAAATSASLAAAAASSAPPLAADATGTSSSSGSSSGTSAPPITVGATGAAFSPAAPSSTPTIAVAATGAPLFAGAASSAPTITVGAAGAARVSTAPSSAPSVTAGATSASAATGAPSSAPSITVGATGTFFGSAASSAPTITCGAVGASLFAGSPSSAPSISVNVTSPSAGPALVSIRRLSTVAVGLGAARTRQPIAWPLVQDGTLEVGFVDGNGDPVNLTGATVEIGIGRSGTAPLLQSTAVIPDPLAGVAVWHFTRAFFADLVPNLDYLYDIQLTDAGGKRTQMVPVSTWRPLYFRP
jgi:hypothetical protein